MKKNETARTEADNAILQQSPEIVQSIGKRRKSRDAAKQRLLEVNIKTLPKFTRLIVKAYDVHK